MAVHRLGLPIRQALDVAGGSDVGFADLLVDATFRKLLTAAKRGRVRWLHGGPPGKTFSRARRSDEHGSAKVLRSERYPQGLPHVHDDRVAEGNRLASRFARLAATVQRAGG